MTKTTLEGIRQLAREAYDELWSAATRAGHDNPKIYLHWTAGRYDQLFDDYHINITGDGTIYACDDLAEVKPHTWRRNTGSIGVALCCCYGGNTYDLGNYPPTAEQIETMAQVIAALCAELHLIPNKYYVLTHSEAADNYDDDNIGYGSKDCYGAQHGCERWDLQYLGTAESPVYTQNYFDPRTGGNVLRGKAAFYLALA